MLLDDIENRHRANVKIELHRVMKLIILMLILRAYLAFSWKMSQNGKTAINSENSLEIKKIKNKMVVHQITLNCSYQKY